MLLGTAIGHSVHAAGVRSVSGCADLDSALCQKQAHVSAPTQLCELQLLGATEHDALGCIQNLLIPIRCWDLHTANCHTLSVLTSQQSLRRKGYSFLLPLHAYLRHASDVLAR